MEEKLAEVSHRLVEINDLESAANVLDWDQNVNMPPGGAEARGRQTATLRRLAHERFIDPDLGKLLDEFQPYAKSLPYWWWNKWDGKIDQKSWIYLGLNVGLISYGLYRIWQKERLKVFPAYQVNENLMKQAKPKAIFLHCLPAYRGKEVSVGVIDGPQSVVFQEAENRLHAQKALMVYLLRKKGTG